MIVVHGTPGTVIHGTMLTSDLLAAFSNALEWLVAANRKEMPKEVGDDYLELVKEARRILEEDPDGDEAHEILIDEFDALEQFAPEGHYFGAHEGDGSDYGFWPQWE